MRSDRALIGIAAFALVFGLSWLASGIAPHSTDHNLDVPAGDYYHIDFAYLYAAPVSATYQVTAGGPARVYLMTDAQYSAFTTTGTATDLVYSNASSGTLSADLPSGGTYHLVIRHEVGALNTVLGIDVTMNYSSISPTNFGIGFAGLLIGVVLGGIGLRRRAKRLAQPASVVDAAESQGVAYFRPPPPPGQGGGPNG